MAKPSIPTVTTPPKTIWLSLKDGNSEALESLYKLYSGALFNYGTKFSSDRDLVKDCLQELFVTLWTKKASLSNPADVRNYLFKAFRNAIFKKMILVQRSTFYDETEDYRFDVSLNMEELMVMEENDAQVKHRLQIAIDGLTSRQKEAIFLKFHEDLSYEEIAVIMEITLKATYKLMGRSLNFLRGQLSKDELLILFIVMNAKLFI